MSVHKIREYTHKMDKVIPSGLVLPSVTSITGLLDKPFLRMWYGARGNKECKRIMQEAGAFGTQMHDYICQYFMENYQAKGASMPKNNIPIKNFHKFVTRYKPEPVLLEQVVYNEPHGFAGTTDGLFRIKDKLVLLDWKSSKHLGIEYKMQLAAYYKALTWMVLTGILTIEGIHDVNDFWIVRLHKERGFNDGEDVVKMDFREMSQAWFGFEGLLQTYKYIKEDEKCE